MGSKSRARLSSGLLLAALVLQAPYRVGADSPSHAAAGDDERGTVPEAEAESAPGCGACLVRRGVNGMKGAVIGFVVGASLGGLVGAEIGASSFGLYGLVTGEVPFDREDVQPPRQRASRRRPPRAPERDNGPKPEPPTAY
jgi:hypothetical protein